MTLTSNKIEFKIRENARQNNQLLRKPMLNCFTASKGESPIFKAKRKSFNISFAKNVQDSLAKSRITDVGLRVFTATSKADRTGSRLPGARLSSFEFFTPIEIRESNTEIQVTAQDFELLLNSHLKNLHSFVAKRDNSVLCSG